MTLLIMAAVLALSPSARAEYRAYQLVIRNADSGAERTVVSTLDHIQYPQYHPVKLNETAEYLTSWRCPGNTGGFKKICSNPKDESETAPKP